MRKKSMMLLSTVVVLAMCSGVAYSASGLKLIVNGNVVMPEVPPQIIEGSMMVPIRAVSEALGADVQWKESEQTVTVNQSDRSSQQRQIDLLQNALAPESADEAVKAWAKAVKSRNGAAQYAILSPELRSETVKTYEEMNWVTGLSSPWIDSYQVSDSVQADDGSVSYDVAFHLKTSTGSAGDGTVKVTIESKDGKWMVNDLEIKDGSEELNGLVVVP